MGLLEQKRDKENAMENINRQNFIVVGAFLAGVIITVLVLGGGGGQGSGPTGETCSDRPFRMLSNVSSCQKGDTIRTYMVQKFCDLRYEVTKLNFGNGNACVWNGIKP